MRRWTTGGCRVFALALCAVFLTICASASAQQPKRMARIGLLALLSRPSPLEQSFITGLRELGYIEGQNISIEYRWAEGSNERLRAMAQELVRLNVDVIAARATPAVEAAKRATTTIPIVMLGAADAVGSGFVSSLARPGGNITGVTNVMPELAGKRLELLREVVPRLSRVAFLAHGGDPAHKLFLKEAENSAREVRIDFQPVTIAGPELLRAAFSGMKKDGAQAVIVQPLFITSLGKGGEIAELAVTSRLPTVSDGSGFAETGGLFFYGPDQFPMFRRAAVFVDKILKVPSRRICPLSSRPNSN